MNLKTIRPFIKFKEPTKFLSVMIIRVFPYLTIHKQYSESFNTEKSKALVSFLNKLETETKLQSFNLKDILKGSWDFT